MGGDCPPTLGGSPGQYQYFDEPIRFAPRSIPARPQARPVAPPRPAAPPVPARPVSARFEWPAPDALGVVLREAMELPPPDALGIAVE